MTGLLLKIKKILRWFGLEVAFVKRKEAVEAILHNSEENMNAFWADPKNRKNWDSPNLKRFYQVITQLVKDKGCDLNGKEILDAGCGTGSLLIYINKEFEPKANFGYEFSKKALEIASTRFPDANYMYKNLNETPDKQFDFIFCTEVLEHILNPHIPFKNLLKMMKDKSGLLITVPNGREDTYAGHINFWSPESWNAFISQNIENHEFETGEIKPYGLFALIKN